MIDVAGVFHHYGLRPTLDDVSFTVDTGQTLAVIGPNGSGKTTLLSLLSGMCSPAEGTVSIGGLVRRSSPEAELAIRSRTVFLPDQCWFPPHTTGRQFLLGVGELYGVSTRRLFEHIDQLLSIFHLDKLGDAMISSYSTGQKKKLGLCSALVTDVDVLLLDEPFSGGLDPAGITAMKQILKHLTSREDRTVVLTTPVPELIEEVADEILILREGTILKNASVNEIKAEGDAETLDDALRSLIFPETESELRQYLSKETVA
jgi:ABC-type multidrug transport system ATPase subunit